MKKSRCCEYHHQSPGIAIPGLYRNHRASAFSIFEVLVVIILLGVFMLVECKLFIGCVKIDKQVHAASNDLAQWQRMVRVLREDVWTAEKMRIENKNILVLHLNENREIRWALPGENGGTITRSLFVNSKQTEQAQSTSDLLQMSWSLLGRDCIVMLKAREQPASEELKMSFLSQASLLKEKMQ